MSENFQDFRGFCQDRGWPWTLCGSFWYQNRTDFFPPPSILDIHAVRPHRGQIEVAFRFRSLLDSDHHPSEIAGLDKFVWVGSWVLHVLGRPVMCCLFSSPQLLPRPSLPRKPQVLRSCPRCIHLTLLSTGEVKKQEPSKGSFPKFRGGKNRKRGKI